MQRPINVPAAAPGIASYTLSAHDEFEVTAVSAILDNSAGGNSIMPMLFATEPGGGTIYLQQLGYVNNTSLISLAPDSEPFAVNNDADEWFPQLDVSGDSTFRTSRMARLTLYTGCTIGIATPVYSAITPSDPFGTLDTGWAITDLLLWVEDTAASLAQTQDSPVPVGPYMLVPGPSV